MRPAALLLGLAASAALAAEAGACRPPPLQTAAEIAALSSRPVLRELVDASARIVIAAPISARPVGGAEGYLGPDPGFHDYRFEVHETLAGEGPDAFDWTGAHANALGPIEATAMDPAARHGGIAFQDAPVLGTPDARFLGMPYCGHAPAFALGQAYLVFLDTDGAALATEPVGEGDAVRTLVAEPERQRPWTSDLRAYLLRHPMLEIYETLSCEGGEMQFRKTGELRPGEGWESDPEQWVEPEASAAPLSLRHAPCEAGRAMLFTHQIAAPWDWQGLYAGAYDIDAEGGVDFRVVYSQVAVEDPRIVPLADIETWFSP